MATASTKKDRLRQKAEQDAVLSRVSLALARSQRLIDSWLPAQQSAEGNDAAGPNETTERQPETQGGWGGLPDGVGLGGAELSNGQKAGTGINGNGTSELDRLRRQLLGKKAGKTSTTGTNGTLPGLGLTASKPMSTGPSKSETAAASQQHQARKRAEESDDDDEGGRSAAFRSKKSKPRTSVSVHPAVLALEGQAAAGATAAVDTDDDTELPVKAPKRNVSYLDEILAERSNKKKKKKKAKADDD